MERTVARVDGPAGSGQLERLREHEQALAELLADAREEADRVVEEERARAESARRRLDEEIDVEAARIRKRARLEAEEAHRDLLAEARARVQHLEEVPEERIAELADGVFRRLFSGEEGR